jgi:hypothetical protein
MKNFLPCVVVQYMGCYLKPAGLVVYVEKDTPKQLLSLGCIHFFGPEQLFMIDTYVVGSFRHF